MARGSCRLSRTRMLFVLAAALLPPEGGGYSLPKQQQQHDESSFPWHFPPVPGLKQHMIRRGIFQNVKSHELLPSASFLAWQRLKSKLNAGQPITVVGIGTSVLGVHGGCTGPAPNFAAMCDICCFPKRVTRRDSVTGDLAGFGIGWARIGFDFLLHNSGGGGHAAAAEDMQRRSRLINYARPGGGPDVYNRCLRKWAPGIEGSDLVLIELNVIAQDVQMDNGMMPAKEIEGLLRQILGFERPPAIMLVNFFNWCKDIRAVCGDPAQPNAEALADLSPIFTGSGLKDSHIQQLGKHYEVPVLSHLHALWHLFFPSVDPGATADQSSNITHPPPLLRTEGSAGLPNKRQGLTHDGIHPTINGNKIFGPMLALALAEVLVVVGKAPAFGAPPENGNFGRFDDGQFEEHGEASAQPLFAGGPGWKPSTGVCFDFIRPVFPSGSDGALPVASSGGSPGAGGVRMELREGNQHLLNPVLYANPAVIAASRGFRYEETALTHQGEERWKPGIVADSPGAFVVLSYSAGEGGEEPNACLTFMESGHGMGSANWTCGGCCACEPFLVDAHRKNSDHTIERTMCRPIRVLQPEAGLSNCTLRLEVTPEPERDDHRFKITSLSFHTTAVTCNHGIC